jgi:hypothetical protein
MNCINCGTWTAGTFCSKCGTKTARETVEPQTANNEQSKLDNIERDLNYLCNESKSSKNHFELFTIIMLSITALLVAWASYRSSEYSSDQSVHYARHNFYIAEANGKYSTSMQRLMADKLVFNELNLIMINISWAIEQDYIDEAHELIDKLGMFIENSFMSDEFELVMEDIKEEWWDSIYLYLNGYTDYIYFHSPFENEGLMESYFVEANELTHIAIEYMEAGDEANKISGMYGLVTVLYAVTLFLLGIASSIKKRWSKKFMLFISMTTFLIASGYMVYIYLLTDTWHNSWRTTYE